MSRKRNEIYYLLFYLFYFSSFESIHCLQLVLTKSQPRLRPQRRGLPYSYDTSYHLIN
jgi:hypothetical protein